MTKICHTVMIFITLSLISSLSRAFIILHKTKFHPSTAVKRHPYNPTEKTKNKNKTKTKQKQRKGAMTKLANQGKADLHHKLIKFSLGFRSPHLFIN